MTDMLCLQGDPQLMESLADCFSFDQSIAYPACSPGTPQGHNQFSPFDFEGFPLIWRPPIMD